MACYLIGSALIAAGIAVGNVIAASFRQQYCPPSLLGRVTANMRFLAYGMIPLGALLAGVLGTTLGVRNALWVLQALFAAACLLLLTPRIRAARQLPGPPAALDDLCRPVSFPEGKISTQERSSARTPGLRGFMQEPDGPGHGGRRPYPADADRHRR